MPANERPLIESVRPTEKALLMDLVARVGIDVADWSNYKNGANAPAANPRFCYNWAFVEGNIIVVNLWYGAIEPRGDTLVLRERVRRGDSVLWTRNRTGPGKARGERLDEAIRTAHSKSLPVRVVIIDGDRTRETGKRSVVNKRRLDDVPWHVSFYDRRTGAFDLTRGTISSSFADQFTDEDEGMAQPRKREQTSEVFERDPVMRRRALERANGVCELCGKTGFIRRDGRVYLEVHHVRSLASGGRDHIANLAAICANDHREAHYGARAPAIEAELSRKLKAP